MDNIKLSLSIILPGSVMWSKEESLKQLEKTVFTKSGKPLKKKGQVVKKLQLVPDFDKHDSFVLRVTENGKEVPLKVFVRSCKPAKQVINITQDGYDYMVSNEKPYDFRGNWNGLSINQKLKWHCINIAKGIGGIVESFQVME